MLPLPSMRPTIDGDCATNHIAPSLPAVIPYGYEALEPPGSAACNLSVPSTVIRPISRPLSSVNHTAPSGPAAIAYGADEAESVGYAVIVGVSAAAAGPAANAANASAPANSATKRAI